MYDIVHTFLFIHSSWLHMVQKLRVNRFYHIADMHGVHVATNTAMLKQKQFYHKIPYYTFQKHDARIIIVGCYEDQIHKVFCEVCTITKTVQ